MREERALVGKHLEALRAESDASGVPVDVLGRLVLERVVELWLEVRNHDDVASELVSTAENLDPDADHEFMRP